MIILWIWVLCYLNSRMPENWKMGYYSSLVTAKLVKDDRFTNISASGITEALRNGFVSRVAGFDVLESLNVPDVTGTAGETGKTDSAIIAGHPMAFQLAEQINKVEAYRPSLPSLML